MIIVLSSVLDHMSGMRRHRRDVQIFHIHVSKRQHYPPYNQDTGRTCLPVINVNWLRCAPAIRHSAPRRYGIPVSVGSKAHSRPSLMTIFRGFSDERWFMVPPTYS